jgi:capsular polysaccharide biosynthesis protein
VNDERLTRRSLLGIALAGLVTAGVALLVTTFLIGSSDPVYRASAQVALVPAANIPAEEVPSYWEALGGGQAASIAAEVFKQSQWLAPAATAAGVTPDKLTITAGVANSTSLINLTGETTSPEGAEAAVTALIKAATPTVQQVSGPYALQIAQPAAGTAAPASIPQTQLLIVVFAGALFLGSGVALVVTKARNRSSAPGAAADRAERRAPLAAPLGNGAPPTNRGYAPRPPQNDPVPPRSSSRR